MHSTIRGALGVSSALVALAVLSAGCDQGGSSTGSADKPATGDGTRRTDRPSPHPGLGDILVGDAPVTGSRRTGEDKAPFERTYTDGALYAAVTGFRSTAFGNAGLESAYGDVLSADASGNASGDVMTTIDPKAQKAAFDALGDRRGAAVALDAESGALLAVVSTPSYDPGTFSGHGGADAKAWKALNADRRSPLLNRALREVGAPGGTFHVVVAAAALEKGLYASVDDRTDSPLTYVLPQSTTRVTGASPGCEDAPIARALSLSCDNVFAKMAFELGADELRSVAGRFGFDDALTVPVRVAESSYPRAGVSRPATALTGIGAGDVRATPLAMARVAAAVANGGRLVGPSLVERVTKADGGTVRPKTSGRTGRAVSRGTADALKDALGTAAGEVPGGDEAGSGTGAKAAWVTDGQDGTGSAWFLAYTDGTKGHPVAVAVRVEDQPSGADPRKAAEPAVAVGEALLAGLS
ncbi:penicillin-binding protein [Streptomyces sp. JV178]|uniref:penicillin-binding transpeptidase domain-containing protein n=1 Tax=Streptomyces sp. JV178 TaxID=858632 RepID=UPI000C1B38E6|nr:penicillin-binding transpeptidase domain-containing protein [Streptomyces sp. JV178]PIM74501.1 penicillin-binding protein [Streptomyces sp. JV178]